MRSGPGSALRTAPLASAAETMSDAPIQSGLTPPNAQDTLARSGAEPNRSFPDELVQLAAQNAGRWVYEIDPALDRARSVPPHRIVGAWRIDETGSPTGEFVANSSYRPSAPKKRRSPRRVALAALALVIVAVVIAGAVLLLVAPKSKHGRSVRVTPGSNSPVAAVHDPATAAAGSQLPGTHQPPATTRSLPGNVRLEVVANRAVWVCLQDARGRLLINGQILQPGEIRGRFASSAFRIFLGNGAVSLRIDGRVHPLAPNSRPVAYRISQSAVVALAAGVQPACA
jgi:hypothetical protein